MPLPARKILLAFFVSLPLYIGLYYFTERSNFTQLMTLYGLAFGGYLFWVQQSKTLVDVKFGLGAAVILRVALLFALPNLSDDFYRFVWDGRMWVAGINPFEHLPAHFIVKDYAAAAAHGLDRELFDGLNSPYYFTIYPPINQYVFGLACWLSPNSIIGAVTIMKLIILAFEIGTFYLMFKLLRHFGLSEKSVLLYALNPLVIIELVGNVHFEAAIIFFVLLAVYLLVKNRWIWSAVAMALAVCSKLVPLLLLPFFLKRLGFMRAIMYYAIVGGLVLLLFATVIDWATLQHMSQSVELYFGKFEFNAGLFYVLRWLGFMWKGYNLIQYIAPVLGLLTFITVWLMVWKERKPDYQNLFLASLMALLVYFSFSTIVHPWYIATLVAFSVFTRYRFAVLWSALIMVSYAAYSNPSYMESLKLVAAEYVLLYAAVIYEWWSGRAVISDSPEMQ